MIRWALADTEEERERGVRLLCRHGDDLGVPYKWSTVLASLAHALDDGGLIVGIDGEGRARGAIAFTCGTGEDAYKDRTRIEVHLLFIDEEARGNGAALAGAIRALHRTAAGLPQPIEEIGFYAAPTPAFRRLFGKAAALRSTRTHPCGLLDFYSVSADSLRRLSRE